MVYLPISSYENLPDHFTGPRSLHQAIGSVQIDEAFQREVEERLKLIPREGGIPHIPKYAANEMAKMSFQDIKRNFGTSEVRSLKEFKFVVPGLPSNFTNTEAKIEKGRMIFTQ